MDSGIIICIDDERVVLNGLQSQLGRDFGSAYAIEIAESGDEALALVTEILRNGDVIPVVISDQLMPGMKGHELLRKIHQLTPATYTILLTGQSDLEAVIDSVNNANLYRYISKPWESQDLVLTVKEAIKGFFQDRQLASQNMLLDQHNKDLERIVAERTKQLQEEIRKSDELLHNILPDEVAMELKTKGEATPRHYEMVSILFTDFQGFSLLASELSPQELVQTLNECYCAFDDITGKHKLEKIKTIGDAYMCAGGLPAVNSTNAADSVAAACEIQRWMTSWNMARAAKGMKKWELRIGIHTGQLVAGVIGKKKFAYDVWGDAVNIASRMESGGEVGKVNISDATYSLVKEQFHCTKRGKVVVKGKGEVDMYFVQEK